MYYPTTEKFNEVLPNAQSLRVLRAAWIDLCPPMIDGKAYITDAQLNTVWALLATKYSEAHINFNSTATFKMKLISLIGEAAPKFFKDLSIQRKLATLNIDDEADMAFIMKASSYVSNHADHPATDPEMSSLESLTYIDAQNTNTSKRGNLESMALLSELMRSDLYTSFTSKFRNLFITVAFPEWDCDEEDSKTQDIKEVTVTHNGETVITPDLGFDNMNNVVVDVQVGEGARIQSFKEVDANENEPIDVFPDEGYDGIANVRVNVEVPIPQIEESQSKYVSSNGSYRFTPTDGYDAIGAVDLLVDVPVGGNVEAEKVVNITSNGTVESLPSSGYDGVAKTKINVNVPTSGSVENFKTVVVTENGSTLIRPSEGYDYMSNVVLNVGVPTPTVETMKDARITENGVKSIFPSSGFDAMGRVNVTVDVQGGGGDAPSFIDWFEEFDWTPSSNIQTPYTIEFEDHGSLPNFLYIWLDKEKPTYNREFGGCMLFSTPSNYNWNNAAWTGNMFYRQTTNQWYRTSPTSSTGVTAVDNTTITLRPNDYSGQQCIFLAGDTYHIFVGRFANAEV